MGGDGGDGAVVEGEVPGVAHYGCALCEYPHRRARVVAAPMSPPARTSVSQCTPR